MSIDLNNEEYDLPSPIEARQMLWELADLTWKLDSNQVQLRNSYINSNGRLIVWAASRRIGKSYTLCTLAIEMCLKKKNAEVKYLADTQKNVKDIIRPLMQELCADAPDHIRPIEKKADGIWFFPSTGSRIKIMGCDGGRAQSARGGNSDLCIIDEAGFVDDLSNIVKNILNPTMIMTKGKLVMASTPPMSIGHEFIMFLNRAKIAGSFVRKTIYDNPRLTPDDVERIANEDCDGKDTDTFKREYLAELIPDSDMSIVPEFTEDLQKIIIKDWKKPGYYHNYVAMDVGARDLTVVLFAYIDFKEGKLIIEDEYTITGKDFTTEKLAKEIKLKEKLRFSDPFTSELVEPHKRVSDNNLLLLQDLRSVYGINFRPTDKAEADAALNNMRILLGNKKIIIHPRCKTLIAHLSTGYWNKQKTKFARSGNRGDGHFDAIDSLKYLVRNVDFNKNPYPSNYGGPSNRDGFFKNGNPANNQPDKAFMNKLMNIKIKD